MQETNLDQIMHRQCHRLTLCFFISDLTNSDTIRYYCETSRLVLLCIALFLWCKSAFYRDQLTSKCEYILLYFLLAKDKFTIKGIQQSRSEYIFLVPALSSACTYPFCKNKVNQKRLKNWGTWKNDKLKVHDTWQGPPSRLFSQPECLDVYFIAGG